MDWPWAGGGKGGDLLGFSDCRRYIVKSVNGGDQLALLDIAEPYVRQPRNPLPAAPPRTTSRRTSVLRACSASREKQDVVDSVALAPWVST